MKTGNDMTLCVGGADSEVWKPIVGFEGTYEISIARRVRRIATGRILKQCLDRYGRPCVCLSLCGKHTTRKVAHLVADAFLPPKSPTDQVLRHLNDDPTDNRIENLAWGTYSDNIADSLRNGKHVASKGIANGRAKLTENQVREIRRLYATGRFSLRTLARQFGVAHCSVRDIFLRKTWKRIA